MIFIFLNKKRVKKMMDIEGLISVINLAGKSGLQGLEKSPIDLKRNEMLGLIAKINKCSDSICVPNSFNRRLVPEKFQAKRSFKLNPQEIVRSLAGILGNPSRKATINRDPFRRLLME